jgi:hypothetical protein
MTRHAPKEPRDRSEDPAVVDLARYRKAQQAQAEAKRKAATPARSDEPFLGARPHAGLILAGSAAVLGALLLLGGLG